MKPLFCIHLLPFNPIAGTRVCLAGLFVLMAVLPATSQTWNLAAGGSWNSGANWNPTTVPNAIGASVTFNSAASGSNPAQTASSTLTLDGSKTVGSITFNNDAVNAFSYTINTGSGGPLVFDAAGAGPATITVNSVSGSTGNNTIGVATTLNDTLVVTVNNTTATSVSGALNLTTAMGGSGGFTKQGNGLMTLATGAKTYSGPTVLSGGRTRITAAGQPSATSSFTLNAGAQLTLNTGGNYTFGSGPLNLNGTGAASGPFAGFPGAMRNDRGNGNMTISNNVVLQTDTLIHVQAIAGTGASDTPGALNTLAGNISGPGRLTLTAPNSDIDQGFLVLNGTNTYTGGTLVQGGILVADGARATFGAGNVTVDNAVSPSSIARAIIRANALNAIADTATLSLSGGGTPGVADQGWIILESGVNEVVGALKLAGVVQPPGTYGSSASAATVKNDEFFAGPGMITVPTPPTLSIALSSTNVVLAWPTNAIGFGLQKAIAITGSWSDDNTSTVPSGSNRTVTEAISTTNTFFRLKK